VVLFDRATEGNWFAYVFIWCVRLVAKQGGHPGWTSDADAAIAWADYQQLNHTQYYVAATLEAVTCG
jgi:hypothetical protein